MSFLVKHLARPLLSGLGQAKLEVLRTISNTAGVGQAEPKLAEKEREVAQFGLPETPSQPRWERELGTIRTDWT